MHRSSLVVVALLGGLDAAQAQPSPVGPAGTAAPAAPAPVAPTTATPAAPRAAPASPRRGDFDAGAQVRLPGGPDELGQFATFNWVAVDAVGRYYLLDQVTVVGRAPIAIIHPDTVGGTIEPATFGGVDVALRATLPRAPFQPRAHPTDVAVTVSGAYARAGAMLLGPRDYPLFAGDFQPGFTAGVDARLRLSSLVDVVTAPVFVYQRGDGEALDGVQLPLTAVVKLGAVVQLGADLAINTGDDFGFGADDGGRIALGGSLTVALGRLRAHAGAGTASLLTGGAYPTVTDGFYLDLDVRYAR